MKKYFYILTVSFTLSTTIIRGQTWSAVGNGVNGRVSCFTIYNGELYVAGQFNNFGGISPFGLMKWNGTAFDTLPGTYLFGSSRIEAMAVYNNELYLGGAFCPGCSPYPSVFTNIAKWNGTSFSSVGTGCDNVVYSMKEYNGKLYVGGDMQTADSVVVNSIAKWDGSQWLSVGGGITGSSARVFELEVYNNELYAAGNFYFAALNTSCIAKWNDTVWTEVGPGGIPGVIYSLGIFNNELYAGGPYFTLAGGVPVNEIARWDGITWASAGSGITYYDQYLGDIFTLKEYHNELYAGGEFVSMDGINSKSIARYNGITWDSCGSGIDSTNIVTDTIIDSWGDTTYDYGAPHTVWTFFEFNNDLYVGGEFNMIGGIEAHNVAKWTIPLSINESFYARQMFINPNPFSTQTVLHTDNLLKNATLMITNIFGQSVKQIKNISGQTITLHRDNLISGLYFIRLTQDNKIIATEKLIITD